MAGVALAAPAADLEAVLDAARAAVQAGVDDASSAEGRLAFAFPPLGCGDLSYTSSG